MSNPICCGKVSELKTFSTFEYYYCSECKQEVQEKAEQFNYATPINDDIYYAVHPLRYTIGYNVSPVLPSALAIEAAALAAKKGFIGSFGQEPKYLHMSNKVWGVICVRTLHGMFTRLDVSIPTTELIAADGPTLNSSNKFYRAVI